LRENFVSYFETIVNEKPADRSSWQCTLKKVKTFTGGHLSFLEIDEEWLRKFQKFLLSEVSQITAWHYYSNVKHVINRAIREKILSEDPSKNIPSIKKPETKREYLTIGEVKQLIRKKCKNNEVKEAFLFCCFTGLRYSDVKALKWENIKDGIIEYKQKKTNTPEYLPISRSAQNILEKRRGETDIESEELIFKIPHKVQVHHNIKNWVKETKIKKNVSFHTVRYIGSYKRN